MAIATRIDFNNYRGTAVEVASEYEYLMDSNTKQCYKRKSEWIIFATEDAKLTDLFVKVK